MANLILKVMGSADLPDHDSRKAHELYANIARVDFRRGEDGVYAHMVRADGVYESVQLFGNAYVLNEQGKTIDSFGPADIA